MDKPFLATINGTMLAPGISKNNRQYTAPAISRAVKRMKERLNDPEGLPVVMRTHHAAGDDSRQIVGRITDVHQETDGSAVYTAKLFNNTAARDLAPLLVEDEKDGKAALRTTSIYGYWVGPVEHIQTSEGTRVEVGEDLEIDAIDFTASPGVPKSRVKSVAFESTRHTDSNIFSEESQATITLDEDGPDGSLVENKEDNEDLEVYERTFTSKQRKSMASSGQAMPGGRYPIANKSDLRNAIRAVGRGKGSHDDIRRHIIRRAKALGLSNLIPPNWTTSGGMKESKPMGEVAEHYVKVCIGDIAGDMVKLCAYNLSPDVIKDAIKQAGKMADQIMGQDGRGLGMQDEDDLVDDVDDIDWKIITCSPEGEDYDTDDYDGDTDDDMPQETVKRIRKKIAAARETKNKEESAMAETQAATAAPSLSEADLTKIGLMIGQAIKEAMNGQADMMNASAKGKAKNKKGKKADVQDGEPQETVETPAAITEADLKAKLEEERKRTIDEIRETFLKENGTPDRRGYRHVSETDESDLSKLSGDDLWNRRSELWAQALPLPQAQAAA